MSASAAGRSSPSRSVCRRAGATFDADGRYVLPGGIDSHCHIEQLSGMGILSADDFYSGTVSAAFGGTTTIIPFAAQHRGTSVTTTVADYHERARTKAVIDYGFHLIIGDPPTRSCRRSCRRRSGAASPRSRCT
jgi:dihydropyrimidinase